MADIRVTAEDLKTGEKGVREVNAGDYVLIVTEPLYLAETRRHGNGTVVLTLKRQGGASDGQ